MRVIKSTLIAAQNLKRKDPNEYEMYIIMRSICDINIPKFIPSDLILFQSIIGDLFSDVKNIVPKDEKIEEILKETLSTRNL